MAIHLSAGYTQVVGRLQRVHAVVVVCWVFKGEAAFDVVLVRIHIKTHILSVGDFLSAM